ncbi:ATP-binding protein [Paraflavisolibacter sp. H34]|uniref:sensor histidine kinase n=1 Tax=Huijunlia imazamoxiresistens TaxID=3127457 RepID=UPI00301617A3
MAVQAIAWYRGALAYSFNYKWKAVRFIRSYISTHTYQLLPAFARHLQEHRLEEVARQQLVLAREVELPALKLLAAYSDEQLVERIRHSMQEFLGLLAEGKATELIELSLERWKADQLEIIGKFELLAEDIYLINYIRQRAFRLFIPEFTTDIETVLDLVDELDSFFTGSTTAATNTYIGMLKDRIARHEQELLDAQRIARMGSFELDLQTGQSNSSPEVYRIFDIEPGTGVKNYMEYIHPQDKERVAASMARAQQEGSYEVEYRFLKGGKLKYIWARGIAVFQNGRAVRIVGTVQDVSLRKKVELELREKTLALERSNESLQQFAYVASHDLKEPLRKIATFTDMVLTGIEELSVATRRMVQRANQLAVHAGRMIDDIMAYSTLTLWGERQSVSLAEVIGEALEKLQHRIEATKARIHFDALPVVRVVRVQFGQLFENLLDNALTFSRPEEPPQISISCTWLQEGDIQHYSLPHADRYLQLSVADNGIGFGQEYAEKIFGLFSRLHPKTEYGGSGLGLAIARRIVDNHSGTIFARSREGQGATFIIILPQ